MSKKPSKKSKSKAPKKSAQKGPKKAAKQKVGKKAASKSVMKSAATAPPSNAQRERAVALFKFAHQTAAKFGSGFADNQVTAQPTPTSNHLLWSFGHLAVSNAWFASLIDGAPIGVSDDWDKMFGMKSKPTSDPAAYPPFAEVQAAYAKSAERIEDAARSRTDADMVKPCASDSGGFCADKLDAIAKAAWHEGWHLGQIAELRKALGLPSAMGS
ncbi:hypothetical protein PHYC_00930 [Phycisphaerales bacterium]|nr:hypothetical protein PHYC_00930 [Phycisphaerales bacterium]